MTGAIDVKAEAESADGVRSIPAFQGDTTQRGLQRGTRFSGGEENKMSRGLIRIIVAVSVVAALGLGSIARGNELWVPEHFRTIREALLAAQPGDTIVDFPHCH